MKKFLIFLIILVILIIVFIFSAKVVSKEEDWICTNDKLVKYRQSEITTLVGEYGE